MSSEPGPAPRRVLVTGTSSGIGQAIARHLLETGWLVTGLDRAAATLDHEGFTAITMDLANPAALERELVALLGPRSAQPPPWAVVHAAGLMHTAPLGALDPGSGERMWQVHVQAAAQLANTLLPALCAQGSGRMILIGSRVSAGLPGRSQYAATKAALIGMARSWAAECARHGVTVNIVSPAATETDLLNQPGRASSPPRLPPIGRLIRPKEIAALVTFLLSDAAAAITGQDIALCGGSSLPQ